MRHEKEADPFYATSAWRRARRCAWDRDGGFCVWCRRAGRYTTDRHGRRLPVRATLVHHIKPRKEYPALALVLSNLVSLCDRCHDEAHPEKFGHEEKKKEPTPAERLGVRFEQL